VGKALTENRQRLVAEPEHGPMPEGEAPIENASPTAHRDRKKTAVGCTLSMKPGLPKRTTFAWNIRIAPPPRQDRPLWTLAYRRPTSGVGRAQSTDRVQTGHVLFPGSK
jgi:hypothetical protein